MRAVAALAVVPLALLAATRHYDDAPPPGHTGGFGEPTCAACHFDGPVDDGLGQIEIRGLPGSYEPGARYPLRVVLSRAGVARAGFQLSARTGCAGAQAGELRSADAHTLVTEASDVAYIHHTRAGTSPIGSDSAVWTIEWTAPTGGGPVVFSVAANAADGDASQLGDHIYTHSRRIEPL